MRKIAQKDEANNQKTKSGFDVVDSQEPGFDEMLKEYIDNLDDDENPFLNPDNDLFASNDDGEMTIEDYQNYIDDFKKKPGKYIKGYNEYEEKYLKQKQLS